VRKFITPLIAAAMAAITVSSIDTASAQEVVKFGVQPATHPIYIAREMGLLAAVEKKHDVKFEWPKFSYGAPENQALAANEIQMASAGMGPAIVASTRLPAKLLAITVLEQTAVLVAADSPIESVAELKGKAIAHPGKGSQQYPLMVKALADAGLKVSDVKLFKTKGSDVATLVANKDVAAGITWDPHVSKALQSGKTRVLIGAKDIMPIKAGHYIGNGVYARTDFIDSHKELVQDVVNTLVQAIDLILADPRGAAKMWADATGLPVEVLNYSVDNKISVFNRDIAPAKETVDAYTKFLKEAGILKPDDNPKFDASFAINALKQ
jgi:sulfonate transport system substrate-binding protein